MSRFRSRQSRAASARAGHQLQRGSATIAFFNAPIDTISLKVSSIQASWAHVYTDTTRANMLYRYAVAAMRSEAAGLSG